jgi:hypothetical protein
VRHHSSLKIEPLLLEEARADLARLRGADVLVTPYLHPAETRELAPADRQVLPLNFVPSEKTLQTLVEVPSDAPVGAVAVDARSRRRLEAIVRQFSAAAVRSALLDDSGPSPGWSRPPTWCWQRTPCGCPGNCCRGSDGRSGSAG